MPLTTEIHVPASPTRGFATMLCFLAHSIAARAALPGPWRMVVALGRDGDLTPASPDFAWARDLPIEFRVADAAAWDACAREAERRGVPGHVHNATILRQLAEPYTADAVLFLDADTVVAGPLGDLVAQVAREDLLAAKPAWQPPPRLDLDAVLSHAGLTYRGPPLTYSGWGWSFTTPRFAPPYLNSGVTLCSNRAASVLQRRLPGDFALVDAAFPGPYVWQVAQMLTVVRDALPVLALDERWNLGIGEATPSILPGAEGAALDALGVAQARDARVIHYCTRTRRFVREREMGSRERLRAFLDAEGLDAGEAMLQAALRPLREAWEAGA